MAAVPSVYFVLGTPGSGRRAIVGDLIENGLAADATKTVLIEEGEPADAADAKLASIPKTEVRRWKWISPELPDVELKGGGEIFFLAAGNSDPITQLEALKPWLARHGLELARVIMVVDCQLAERTPALAPWFDACVHFSDVVFLTKREGVANKWLSDFTRRYADQFVPSHFIQLKKGGVPNPALVLDPQPRRVSQYFEEEVDLSGIEIETDDEETEEDEEEDGMPAPEPYFVRQRSGRREKELPDIADFLEDRPAAG